MYTDLWCFVLLQFCDLLLVWSCDSFTHILQVYFIDAKVIVWLPSVSEVWRVWKKESSTKPQQIKNKKQPCG